MIKQSASRSHRYKGFKVKHFLQICAVLALCIWLLSQFKDTCDKGIGAVQNVMNEHGAIKLGRKDLDPHKVQGSSAENKETEEEESEDDRRGGDGEESEDDRRGGDGEESEDDRRGGDGEKAEGEESEEIEVLEDLIDEEDTEV